MPDNFGNVRRLAAPGEYTDVDLFPQSVYRLEFGKLPCEQLVVAGEQAAADLLRKDLFSGSTVKFNTPVLLDPIDVHLCASGPRGYKGVRPQDHLLIGKGTRAQATQDGRFPRLIGMGNLADEHTSLVLLGDAPLLRICNLAPSSHVTVIKNLAAISLGDVEAP